MNELILISGIFIGSFTVTSYRSVPNQTDNSPYYTATGEHVCIHGVAVSQDWLQQNGGQFKYGDWLYIEGVGLRKINDCMNKRYKKRFDIWVPTWIDEHTFHQKYKNTKLKVYLLKGKNYEIANKEAKRNSNKKELFR